MEATCDLLRSMFAIILVITLTTEEVGGSIGGLCPTNCRCGAGGVHSQRLTVDCQGRPDVHDEQLSTQLDSLLSSNFSYGNLEDLRIINSPLTHVPRSICELPRLTHLHLVQNRITRLPDNCLGHLTNLTTLCMSKNLITTLQDGLFDGLAKLATLRFDHNRISSIGLSVFDSSARLTNVTYVTLANNNLTTLEPWPYVIGINGHRKLKDAYVSLRDNSISNFTNKMGLKLSCGMKKVKMTLVLAYNKLQHISDWLKGWKINLNTVLCLNFLHNLNLDGNLLICDCVDYIFYIMSSFSPKSGFLKGALCSEPDSLFRRRIVSIPIDLFVCELKQHCPRGCQCVHRPANSTLHIYCSDRNLTVLPLRLPELPKSHTKYNLDFHNNHLIRRLEHRDYFVNTSVLDASYCGIETVDNWTDVFSMKDVYLHGNRLASVPRSVTTLNVSSEQMSLYGNPWTCSCDDRWMKKWIRSVSDHLLNAKYISCASPPRLHTKAILRTSDKDFCEGPAGTALPIGMSLSIGILSVLLSVVVVYRLRLKLYTRWKFHPFDRDECLGEDMDFDVFLSSHSQDNLPHGNGIREQLEQRGYRVCYPPRDFVAGDTINDNIYRAIVRSKRTVCLLTTHFLERLNEPLNVLLNCFKLRVDLCNVYCVNFLILFLLLKTVNVKQTTSSLQCIRVIVYHVKTDCQNIRQKR